MIEVATFWKSSESESINLLESIVYPDVLVLSNLQWVQCQGPEVQTGSETFLQQEEERGMKKDVAQGSRWQMHRASESANIRRKVEENGPSKAALWDVSICDLCTVLSNSTALGGGHRTSLRLALKPWPYFFWGAWRKKHWSHKRRDLTQFGKSDPHWSLEHRWASPALTASTGASQRTCSWGAVCFTCHVQSKERCNRLLANNQEIASDCYILQGTVGAGLDAGGSIQAETWQKGWLWWTDVNSTNSWSTEYSKDKSESQINPPVTPFDGFYFMYPGVFSKLIWISARWGDGETRNRWRASVLVWEKTHLQNGKMRQRLNLDHRGLWNWKYCTCFFHACAAVSGVSSMRNSFWGPKEEPPKKRGLSWVTRQEHSRWAGQKEEKTHAVKSSPTNIRLGSDCPIGCSVTMGPPGQLPSRSWTCGPWSWRILERSRWKIRWG